MKNSTNSIMTKKIEIVTRKPQSQWWKQPCANLEQESVQLLLSWSKANIVGTISKQAIKQLHLAGYAVCQFEGEYGSYRQSVAVPLSNKLPWQGIKTILENCGHRVTIRA